MFAFFYAPIKQKDFYSYKKGKSILTNTHKMYLKSNPNGYIFNSNHKTSEEDSLLIEGNTYLYKNYFLYAELDKSDSFPPYHIKIFINLKNNKKVLFKEEYDYTKTKSGQTIHLRLSDFNAKYIDVKDQQLIEMGYQLYTEKYKTARRKFLINQQLTIDFNANN